MNLSQSKIQYLNSIAMQIHIQEHMSQLLEELQKGIKQFESLQIHKQSR